MKFRSVKLIFLPLLFFVFVVKAQDQQAIAEDTTVYKYVETQPSFPGGMPALALYFQQNLKYPESALYKRREGRSIIEFVVNKDGSISSVKAAKGFDEACDQEACRLISIMPAWKAGINRGKPVRVKVLLPIVFRLPFPDALAPYREPENKSAAKATHSTVQQPQADTTGGDNSVRIFVEHQPEYPGGLDSMNRFIQKHLKYPGQAKRMGTEGKVFVQFVVNKDGSISDVETIKGISSECNAEAKRVVSVMPAWKPGTQDGKFVRVKYVLPINFRLEPWKRK